jgi:copper transport protein
MHEVARSANESVHFSDDGGRRRPDGDDAVPYHAPVIERGRSRATHIRRLVVAVLIVAICSSGLRHGVVSAHAEVVDVTPAPGSVVPVAPAQVVVAFTERVSIDGGSIELFDDVGSSIAVEANVVDTTVTVTLPTRLADGTYLVAWRVVSGDSHPVTGSSTFSVGAVSSAVAIDVGDSLPTGVGLWRVLAMAATYGGVLMAVGVAWFARRWRRHPGRDLALGGPDPAVLDRVVTVAALVGVGGLLLAFPARIVTVAGGWDGLTDASFVADTIRGPIGQATVMSAVGSIGVSVWNRRSAGAIDVGRGSASTIFGIVCSLMAIGGFALEGHTRTKDPGWLMVLADFVHLAAGSVWVGGVVALAFVLRRARGSARATVVLDVSSAALVAVGAVSLAGVAMSVMVLPSFNALADTGYGLALLAKMAIVVVLLAIGERNRIALVPAIERSVTHDDPAPADAAVRALRRSLVIELFVFALLLAATATLVGRSPVIAGRDVAADGIDSTAAPVDAVIEPRALPLSSGVGSVVAAITPGGVGANVISLTLVDLDGAPLIVVEPPTIELRELVRVVGPLEFVMRDLGGGKWEAPVDIPFAGAWELTVQARTGTFDTGDARTEFVVPT